MIVQTLRLMALSELPHNQPAQVKNLCGDVEMNRRLRELGFYEKAQVTVKSRMPFGGPLVIMVDEFALAIRKSEAANILVESL